MSNETERLAALEAQFTATSSQLNDIKGAMVRLEAKLDAWQATYVPRIEIQEMFRSRDEKIAALQGEINDIHAEKAASKQLFPGWAQVAVAVLALVITLWSLTKG